VEGRVAQFAAIRRDARVEGLSIRELATKYRVHRRTVRQALANPCVRHRCADHGDWTPSRR
jgi:lambda repressor-like predicted transcriptional regulator